MTEFTNSKQILNAMLGLSPPSEDGSTESTKALVDDLTRTAYLHAMDESSGLSLNGWAMFQPSSSGLRLVKCEMPVWMLCG
jgi:hypothetical protein